MRYSPGLILLKSDTIDSMLKLIGKIFVKLMGGSRNERMIRSRMKHVLEQFNPLEDEMRALSDEQMLARSEQLRGRLENGESRESIKAEAFALVREASRRARDHRQFDVQLVAGLILDEGKIAEEATGEGKTIACYPAIYMAALEGLKTHVVTTNDCLVERDAQFARPIFEMLGMTVGYITGGMDSAERQKEYACNVTYGTNSEFGFDYLRDNMKLSASEQVQGQLGFAIVDEVDSILIDEARTPLIISGPSYGKTDRYRKADTVARELINRNRGWDRANQRVEALKRSAKALNGEISKTKGEESDKAKKKLQQMEEEITQAEHLLAEETKYYEIELDRKSVHMTHEGVGAAQEIAGIGSFYVGANMEWPHLMGQSLRAHLAYEKDKDYVVQNGQIVIVDEFTGRMLEGREWSDGLHQAVGAKERVAVKEENQTLATITLQNYFKLYEKLAGMTGTAMTEADEFMKIYSLDPVSVPNNKPCIRDDHHDRIYADEDAKFRAIVEEINEISKAGRPILVGTTSIENSEKLSNMLTRTYGVEHEVLNGRAENAARETEIVAKAGFQHPLKAGSKQMIGNVTIATNMAGRGTDIKLGPNVADLGGLHIIGTERHEARRIDNQLRGRSGRQGDPGSSRFFLSIRDDLMAVFAGEWTLKVLGWLGLQGDVAIEDKRVSKGIERAQKKVEERNFETRKNLLEYDEVMDHQRHVFYSQRQNILEGKHLEGMVMDMVHDVAAEAVESYLDGKYPKRCIAEWAGQNLQTPVRDDQIRAETMSDLEDDLRARAKEEAYSVINMTLGEYMDDYMEAEDWDLRGLSSWAMSRFNVNLSQNQLRKMNPHEVESELSEAAAEKIDQIDLSPLAKYLEDDFAAKALAQWIYDKFNIEVPIEELTGDQETVTGNLTEKVARAYSRREIEYPVEYALERTIGQAGSENVYAVNSLIEWANRKYDAGLVTEDILDKPFEDIRHRLIKLSEAWTTGGKLEQTIRDAVGRYPPPAKAAEFAGKRFDTELTEEDFDNDAMARLVHAGKQFLRREMTELERFVLLQVYDSSWKDHLLTMDHLKSGIGLRGYAEQDPRVAYKREGSAAFREMLSAVQDKITDMIFKVRLSADAEMSSVYEISSMVHEQLSGYDHLARDMADQQAAAEPQKVETIVRDIPRVGRNDPCPCGSGKKYKKCCGKGL